MREFIHRFCPQFAHILSTHFYYGLDIDIGKSVTYVPEQLLPISQDKTLVAAMEARGARRETVAFPGDTTQRIP